MQMPPNLKPISFDAHSLALFKKRLLNCPRYKLKYKPDAKDAAVLVPLCVVNHKPSILFTVRNLNMRVHRGEVSFPGGKTDETDSSTEFTALREAQEEIGVDPTSIDILGRFSTLPNKDGSLKVHPYVGFIKDEVNLTNFNQEEVHDVFTVPVDYLLRPESRETKMFRDSKLKYTVFKMPKEIGPEKEIWGLTSFILDGVLRKLLPQDYK